MFYFPKESFNKLCSGVAFRCTLNILPNLINVPIRIDLKLHLSLVTRALQEANVLHFITMSHEIMQGLFQQHEYDEKSQNESVLLIGSRE